ncbi:MAG: magnesium transporter [Chthoniobacteraceae bacterium]
MNSDPTRDPSRDEQVHKLFGEVMTRSAPEAAALLADIPIQSVEEVVALLNPALRQDLLAALPRERRELLLATASTEDRRQWTHNETFADHTVGRLMEPALAVFEPQTTIAQAVQRLHLLTARAFITYVFVAEESERLCGVVAMREMLLGRPDQPLSEIMIREPFVLRAEQDLVEAMKATLMRHFPVYPVVDAEHRLIGVVRGQMLFEAQAFELSSQAGSMVGVEKEERLYTHWSRSLRFRHPWLQLNLITAFCAAAVVGYFEDTVARFVALAVFQPVLAGQSGNTGCQALAVMLRGITLGELRGSVTPLVLKEAWLGLCNGTLVGLTSGLGMVGYTMWKPSGDASPWMLGAITLVAMMGSCVISGVAGALVPLAMKRLGADPATASGIFVTTATDVASMGTFLGLATIMLR